MSYTHRIENVVNVPFDVEARLAAIPRDNWVKGLFFPRLIELIGDHFPKVAPKLAGPPRLGKYLPFANYPGVDYSRLLIEAARIRHRGVPLAEALRRLQRDAVMDFAESSSGRVTMSLVDSFERALLQFPGVQRIVLGIDAIKATQRGARDVVLEYSNYHGWLDCAELGVIEGIAAHWDARISIEVELDPRRYWNGSYRIRW